MSSAGTVTATLTLNATNFIEGIDKSSIALDKFTKSLMKLGSMRETESAFSTLSAYIEKVDASLEKLKANTSAYTNFDKMSAGVKRMSESLVMLSESSLSAEKGMNIINSIIDHFNGSIGNLEVKVKGSANSVREIGTSTQQSATKTTSSFNEMRNALNQWALDISRTGNISSAQMDRMNFALQKNLANFPKLSAEFLKLAESSSAFNSIATNMNKVAVATNQYSVGATNVRRSTDQLTASLMKNSEAMRLNGAEQLKNMGYTGRLSVEEEKASASSQKLATTQQQVANSSRQSGSAMNTMSSSAQRSSASMNQMASTSTKLGQALYSLMRVGRLVAIMFGYQIAYQFLHATTETVNARSEMENYARMLNWSSTEVDNFNKSLDETVNQFQRVNKYSLGETTMSIGVEFDLTPSQMSKANPIIAMITSEYMRAGRTPAEASLAVKDILQGEFTRLSRETGVGEEELINAGWSGDIKDIDGLLSALEKVGTSRHWDQFAEKAHSINDAITILQNRFGEWSAELVNYFQPAIVNAFNQIMESAGGFAESIRGFVEWISGDGIGQSVVKWTALGVAILGVVKAIVSARTSASLLQVIQMGLGRTITATVFGLNAETVALVGSRNAILSKITAIKAETVANMSLKQVLATKVLGLEAEVVAQRGVKQGILDASFARELERMRISGATKEEMLNTLALYENELAHKRSISILTAHALGLNMATYAEHGFLVAMVEAKTGIDATTVSTMTLTAQLGLLTISFVAPLAIVGAFAVALGSMAWEMHNSAQEMSKFNDLIENGGDKVKSANKLVDKYTKKDIFLRSQLSRTTEGSKEYNSILEKIAKNTDKVSDATDNATNTYKAWQRAISAKDNYDEANLEMSLDTASKLSDAYQEAGYSATEAGEMANSAMSEANGGAEQLRRTLQKLAVVDDKHLKNTSSLLDAFSGTDVPKEVVTKYINAGNMAQDHIRTGLEKGMTDESFLGRLDGWLTHYQGHMENWWNEFNAYSEAGKDDKALEKFSLGVAHGLADLPIFNNFWDYVFEKGGIKDRYQGQGWLGLLDAFTYTTPVGFLRGVGDKLNEGLQQAGFGDGVFDIIKNSIFKDGDPLENLSNYFRDTIGKFFEGMGKDFSDAWNNMDWGNWGDPLGSLTDFFSDSGRAITDAFWGIMESIGQGVLDLGNFIKDSISKGLGLDNWGELTNIFDPIIQGLTDAWNNFISFDWLSGDDGGSFDLASILSVQDWITNLETQLINLPATLSTLFNTYVVQPIQNTISEGIRGIPIIGDILQMLGLIPSAESDAYSKGFGLSSQIKTGVRDVIANIPILGDILRILGIIPQANPTANANGNSVGSAITNGLRNGISGLANIVKNEFLNALSNINNLIGDAWNVASQWAGAIVQSVKNTLHINSPGIVHDLIGMEFGTYVPQAIDDSGATAFASAQQYGQQVVDGVSGMYANMPQVAMDFFTNGALSEYQTDANTVTTLSSDLSLTTVDAFNSMQSGVNTSVTGMASDVSTQYMAMQQNQNTMMTNMQNANLTGYRQMNLQTNQQLLSMRNETQQVTTQMIGAWSHMKTQLVATANALRNESSAHFNSLSSTIGSFYRKIQNPANWGAGHGSGNVRTARNPTVGKSFAKGIKTRSGSAKHYAGGDYYTGRQTMTLRTLKNLMCPNGDCGTIFDGMDLNKTVDVNEFLASVGLGHGFGTWGSWNGTHYNYIKNKSDQWNMKSPQLLGRINTNADFKVGDFENGTPKISFGSFQSMAESLFSAIPYKFYYDSSWKGSWLGAIQAGACNCYDGASALIAFANTCGFSGSMAHGTWNGIPHVWAVIEGRKMDTTGWQQRGTWTPSASAGGLSSRRYAGGESKTYNISINIDTIYGEDDFENKMRESAQRVMREEFNDPYTIPI